jgi:CheY-like chemotaxis protein
MTACLALVAASGPPSNRILLVDDRAASRKYLLPALVKRGFSVTLAADVPTGRHIFATADRFQLVVCHLVMWDNALDFVRDVKRASPDQKILTTCTTNLAEMLFHTARALGVEYCVAEPPVSKLVEAVVRLIGRPDADA